MKRSHLVTLVALLGVAFVQCGNQDTSTCTGPKLAPNQPNGSSALASVMVAMDSQLEVMHRSAMTNPDHDWSDQRLVAHDLLGQDPTDASMVNAHFGEHAPLYAKAIEQFNAAPSAERFNAIVTACSQCHQGTCPGPLERIEKRRVSLD
jgi:hypothetical protein